MPELDQRVGRLERECSVIEQRHKGLEDDVRVLQPLPGQLIRLEGGIQSLREALGDVRREIKAVREGNDAKAKDQSEERRALKLALIGLTGVILAAVIGGVFVLIASHS